MKLVWRYLSWCVLAGLALQVFFLARIATMAVVAPESTAFMRSEIMRVGVKALQGDKAWRWSHQWVEPKAISNHLRRAVIASEDGGFVNHAGVDWAAIESAWDKNQRRQAQAEKRAAAAAARAAQKPNATPPRTRPAKIIGGSTITQQLAKNLFLSGERNLLRKGQELVLALMIEAVLDKDRILTIYLNSVEWGHGVFGAQAASQRYFKKSAAQLSRVEAARLAVMLPSPKFFETRTSSAYLSNRAGTTLARMPSVQVP
ncbi:MAG: transglycosylase domain-containing protein [Hydrogenophaga sp.]|jgi:monofunctional glycosyltransferase|nr:transglycosylase domain-containing protein [Hydrogenophaga sp.]